MNLARLNQRRDQVIQGVCTGAMVALAASLVIAGALLYF